jgi:hypothetical protein
MLHKTIGAILLLLAFCSSGYGHTPADGESNSILTRANDLNPSELSADMVPVAAADNGSHGQPRESSSVNPSIPRYLQTIFTGPLPATILVLLAGAITAAIMQTRGE